MKLSEWGSTRIKNLGCMDIALVKLSVAGFVLMLVSLWPPLASLGWYWYALVFVLAAIKPFYAVFRK